MRTTTEQRDELRAWVIDRMTLETFPQPDHAQWRLVGQILLDIEDLAEWRYRIVEIADAVHDLGGVVTKLESRLRSKL